MTDEQQQVAELIRNGGYFAESRAWYKTLYIGPIAERTFFLIVAIVAGLVAIVSFIAVVGLLPVTEHTGVLVATNRMDTTNQKIDRIRSKDMPMNQALLEFFVSNYVALREGYDAPHYQIDYAFIRAHSDDPTFAAYAQSFGADNPRSPVNLLGTAGTREVSVDSVTVNDKVEPKLATVKFSTEITGAQAGAKTQWTAVIQFYYSDLTVTQVTDPNTGEITVQTQEPIFQVVNYALTQAP